VVCVCIHCLARIPDRLALHKHPRIFAALSNSTLPAPQCWHEAPWCKGPGRLFYSDLLVTRAHHPPTYMCNKCACELRRRAHSNVHVICPITQTGVHVVAVQALAVCTTWVKSVCVHNVGEVCVCAHYVGEVCVCVRTTWVK